MWGTMLMLKRNLDSAIGALGAFQREYDKMELLLGQLRHQHRKYREERKTQDRFISENMLGKKSSGV